MAVELTESLLSKAAGWEAMKIARAYLAQGQVLSSYWEPPLLRGVVQAGGTSFRASMVIKSSRDIENLCHCREARQWGKICAHSVAVGLHWMKAREPDATPAAPRSIASVPPTRKPATLEHDDAGEPVELHLILPTNLEQAIARGRVMLAFEAKWGGGRGPLNALPKRRAFAFSAQDKAILQEVDSLTSGETPAVLQLDLQELAALLPTLVGYERLSLGKANRVRVTRTPLTLPLQATLEANGEISLALHGTEGAWLAIGDWAWQNGTLQPLGLPTAAKGVLQAPVRVPRSQVPLFLSQHWPQLQAASAVTASFTLDDFTLESQPPRFLLELRGGLARLNALLQCAYGPRIMTIGATAPEEGVWLPDPEVPTRYATRDIAAERAALGRLQRSGFSGPDAQNRLQLSGQDAVLNFFGRAFPKLQREWSVALDEHLENRTLKNIERVEPRFDIRPSGVQWFDLGVVFTASSGETLSRTDVQRLLLSGQSHTRLKNGKVAVLDTGAVEELQEVLLDCSPEQHTQGYRINSAQAGFLDSTLRQHPDWRVQAPSAWRERAEKQHGKAELACPPLGELTRTLRPYQEQGVAWLQFLRENGFGGILADEMGLGKTLETLAFLEALRIQRQQATLKDTEVHRPHLIVCPTSLVFNWLAEAKRFTPKLKVLALDAPNRYRKFGHISGSDIVITSYALIRRDAERYCNLEFDTVVLDEAQHIKNRQTQNARAVKAVRAQHRLVLTGTPLENSVLDLWSIFDFLMPGYLGSAEDFRERYEQPITQHKNVEAQTRLARRLRPFLLRRLKRDVATDLPDRLEQVSFCELTPNQRAVYQQVIEAARNEVLSAVGTQGEARGRMVALNALLRLRQVCCDLRLLQIEGVTPAKASGKLDLFSELLAEVLDGGHRVLVFSQFVSMLTLVRERLTAEDINFCYLDGSTTDRGAVVERFQHDHSVPVFLISLKAGGVGLNLTGADTVIHFDPWWNPAVEDQATDRAHRIGQTRVVTSYKLIARDTVEEKILALQSRKREVIQATLGSEQELAATLTWREIQELLT
jgi:superfamily II DNA or RNA helicase